MIFQFLKVYQNNIAVISKINCSLSVRRKRCKNVLIRLAVKARGSEVQKTMAKYTKRRDKRGYEWKSAYREKEALMLERGYPEVSPHDFYRELFPAGSLQQEPEDGKGNIIATQIRPSGKGRTRQWVIDDSLKMLDKVAPLRQIFTDRIGKKELSLLIQHSHNRIGKQLGRGGLSEDTLPIHCCFLFDICPAGIAFM